MNTTVATVAILTSNGGVDWNSIPAYVVLIVIIICMTIFSIKVSK